MANVNDPEDVNEGLGPANGTDAPSCDPDNSEEGGLNDPLTIAVTTDPLG